MKPIILFDGECNLCNSSVQFVLKRDKKAHFTFASLQGKTGEKIKKEYQLPNNINSFILIENTKVYKESTAALKVVRKLKGLWKFLYILIALPPFIRNRIYKIVAKNRYKWFGKREYCMIPKPEYKERFLEE